MNENEQLHEIMTLKETAAYFRCSERHMQNLILRGLPHFRVGSLLRFRKEEVLEFLSSNQKLSRRRQHQKVAEMLG